MSTSLRLFYLYRVASRFYFHLPVLFVFLWLTGFSLLEIEGLLALYGITITITSGAGSLLGRRLPVKSIIAAGELAKGGGLLLLVNADSLMFASAAQVVGGLGYSLAAGTDNRLFSRLVDDPDEQARIQSNTQSWMFIAVLVSGVVGAVMFAADRESVFYASAVAAGVACAAVAAIRTPAGAGAPLASDAGPGARAKRSAARRPTATAEQRWWSHYYVTVRATTLAGFVGFLPYLFFEVLRVDLAYFGAVLSIFSLAAFVAARYALAFARRIGLNRLTVATVVLSVAAFALFGAVENLGVALLATALLGLSSGGVRPLAMRGLSRDTSAEERARLVTGMERTYGLANATILVAGGLLLAQTDFQTLMLALAAAYAGAAMVLLRRPPETAERPNQASTAATPPPSASSRLG
jgi:MFS family permease